MSKDYLQELIQCSELQSAFKDLCEYQEIQKRVTIEDESVWRSKLEVSNAGISDKDLSKSKWGKSTQNWLTRPENL
jgi:hypothetical protein